MYNFFKRVGNLIIVLFLIVLPTQRVFADTCKSSSTPPTTTISNPCPQFFVDLTNKGGDNTFAGILRFAIQSILGIVGLLAVLFVIIGGFQYITSGGNEEQAEAGKKTLTNAIIGIVIVVLSFVIINVISTWLAGS